LGDALELHDLSLGDSPGAYASVECRDGLTGHMRLPQLRGFPFLDEHKDIRVLFVPIEVVLDTACLLPRVIDWNAHFGFKSIHSVRHSFNTCNFLKCLRHQPSYHPGV
jgi:hypothetical protein